MPLLDVPVIGQVLLVFVLVALLALVLRWAFSRGKNAPAWPEAADRATPDVRAEAALGSETRPYVPGAPDRAPPAAAPVSAAPEDFGLLAVAAIVATVEDAARIKGVLANNGIRATTTTGGDGRHRVLVFSHDLLRARRVAG